MTNKIYLVKLALKNRTVNDDLIRIIRAIGDFEIILSGDERKPDLLIYELGKDTEKDIAMIQSLLDKNAVGEVFLTCEIPEPKILMQAIRIGVNEFFPQPVEPKEIGKALELFKTRRNESMPAVASKNGHIITTFGSKGGVGTTTVAVNLAVAMALKDNRQSVALIDMNTLFGEIPLFLEVSPKFHWGEITKNIDRLDTTFLTNVLTRHNTGLHILPSPAYLNGHIRPTPDTITRLLSVMKGMFDYVIIDGGQSTDDTVLRVVELSDTLLLITILSLPCLANSNKLIKSFVELGYLRRNQIKVVVNRYLKRSEISLNDAKDGIGEELSWIIPNDYQTTMSAINQGKPLSKVAPNAQITQNFDNFAEVFISPEEEKEPKKKFRIFGRSGSKS
jgi:pilus assembly protein CpaE